MTVRLARPGRFSRLTAVLVNADTSAAGFSARRLDWAYLTDSAPFRVSAGRSLRLPCRQRRRDGSAIAPSRSRAKLSRSAIAS